MTDPGRPIGLGFFGAVIASISHEITNRITIINEQTLLMKDLVQVSLKGPEPDLGLLVDLVDSVNTEIGSADNIIKTMNQFAHSVDNLKGKVDVDNVIDLVAALYKRIAGINDATLEVHHPPKPVFIDTIAFFLMNLIWLCLNATLEKTDKNRTIRLGCEQTKDGASVWLGSDSIQNDINNAISRQETTDLANGLGAEILFLQDKHLICIMLPSEIDWLR